MEDIPEACIHIVYLMSDIKLLYSHDFLNNNTNAEKAPLNCEVTDAELFDDILADTYAKLPPLRSVYLA